MRDFTNFKKEKRPSLARGQGGFTLIEIAISLMVVGILMGAGMIGWASYIHNFRAERTQERMDQVMNSLSRYVQSNYRLPCPANPGVTTGLNAGIEGGSNGNCLIADTGANASATYANMQGIVPWRTLGIPEEITRDAWGRPFTYRPAPNLTVNMFAEAMRDTANTGASSVHQACLNEVWYETKDASGVPAHVDRAKALFCCNASPNINYLAQTNTALPANWRETAVFAAGALTTAGSNLNQNTLASSITAPVVISNRWSEDASTAPTRMGRFDYNPLTDPLERKTTQGRTAGVGVTLISHGGDGFLAFITGKSARNRSMADLVESGTANLRVANMAQDELLNVWPPQLSSGTVFNPKVGAGRSDLTGKLAGASDDMVTYARTDQIYGFLGDASCSRPKVLAAISKSQSNPCVPQFQCDGSGNYIQLSNPSCGILGGVIQPAPTPFCSSGSTPPCVETSSCSPSGTTIFNTGGVCGVTTTSPVRCCTPDPGTCVGGNRITVAANCAETSTADPLCAAACSGQVCSGGRLIESFLDSNNSCQTRDLGCCLSGSNSYCQGCNRVNIKSDCTESQPFFDPSCDASCVCPTESDRCIPGTQIRETKDITTCEWRAVGVDVGFCPACAEGQRCGGTNNRDLITTVRAGGSCSTTAQSNHPSCAPGQTCRLRPTPAVELLFADTDVNKAYDYIYFDPATRLLRDVPECTGAAGTDSAFDVVTKACTDSSVYGLVRVNGGSYEVWGRKCEDCPTGQSACMSADMTWTVAGMTCTARVAAANHNANRNVTDSETTISPGTGAAGFLCNDGSFTVQPGATCTGSCTAETGRTWGTSPQCTGDLPAGNEGDSTTITNTVSPQTGSATFACSNGTWTETSGTCNPAGCTLNGTYQWGPGNACQGDGTGIFIADGGTGSVINTTTGRVGSATFTCANGVVTPGTSTCNLQQCSPQNVAFGSGCSANVPAGAFGDVVTRPNTVSGFTAGSQADFTCNASGGWDVSNVVCNPIINASCNSFAASTTPPAAGTLCAAGTETGVTTNATTFTWNCNSPNGGTNANCSSPRRVNATCGSSSGQIFPNATPPATNLCANGATPTVATNASTYTWTCPGTNGGSNASCSALRQPPTTGVVCCKERGNQPDSQRFLCTNSTYICDPMSGTIEPSGNCFFGSADSCISSNGVCGTQNGQTVASLTSGSTGLCSSGYVRNFVDTGSGYTWFCNNDYSTGGSVHGVGGSFSVPLEGESCSATRVAVVNGSCGGSSGGTFPNATPPSSNLCNVGTPTTVSTNPTTYTWSCNGSGGGTNSSCTATRAPVSSPGICGGTSNSNTDCNTPGPTTGCGPDERWSTVSGATPLAYCAQYEFERWADSDVTCTYDPSCLPAVNGSCGGSSGGTFPNATPPSSNLCNVGTPTTVSTNATTYTWSCNGANGGTNSSCTATREPPTPVCTWVDVGFSGCRFQRPAQELDTDCTSFAGFTGAGSTTPNPNVPDGHICIHGEYAGDGNPYGNSGCATAGEVRTRQFRCDATSTPPTPVNGVCGGSSGGTFPNATPPSSNLCNLGTPTTVSTNPTTYTWSCNGSGGGSNDSCTATRAAGGCTWRALGICSQTGPSITGPWRSTLTTDAGQACSDLRAGNASGCCTYQSRSNSGPPTNFGDGSNNFSPIPGINFEIRAIYYPSASITSTAFANPLLDFMGNPGATIEQCKAIYDANALLPNGATGTPLPFECFSVYPIFPAPGQPTIPNGGIQCVPN